MKHDDGLTFATVINCIPSPVETDGMELTARVMATHANFYAWCRDMESENARLKAELALRTELNA